jgi:hypothetical protein
LFKINIYLQIAKKGQNKKEYNIFILQNVDSLVFEVIFVIDNSFQIKSKVNIYLFKSKSW